MTISVCVQHNNDFKSGLQEDGPLEPQQETLQQIAARIIQKTWRGYVYREVFKYFKDQINSCNRQDPRTILKTVNPRETELLDTAAGVFVRFRLGGTTFPPNIYYKIFTYRPITDVCAYSPKDYTKLELKKTVDGQTETMEEDRSGWYQRKENNNWRLYCSKVVPLNEPVQLSAKKKIDFHYSKLKRQQDIDKFRKQKKIEWMKQMYDHGRLQTETVHEDMETLMEKSYQEVMDSIEEKEDEGLLAWAKALNFDDYMQDWTTLACSYFSEPSRDVHSYPPWLDLHELAAEADEDS
ncbi:protein MFI isoform X1 [Etheostoma spectabile]|uniref:protein MFI isoform X1 n=1 Tax=Etheostoma spectabile TaxID=54343 RepID=UPI0013AE9502|nr:uncharacterized protein C11orf65 homolog isoform X1 [Etheostoma spectabile]